MQFSVTILLGMMFVAALVRGKPKTYLVETADDGVETAGGNDYQLVRNIIYLMKCVCLGYKY